MVFVAVGLLLIGGIILIVMNSGSSNEIQPTTGNNTEPEPPVVAPPVNTAKIVFFSDGGAFIVNPDGSNQTQLSDSHLGGSWSPDGSKIAFLSSAEGYTEIFVVNADGSNRTQLTFNYDRVSSLAWSPDGSKIAFSSWDSSERRDKIFVIDADGSNQRQLSNGDSNVDLSWSPDGSKIAFTLGVQQGKEYNRYIAFANLDDGNISWFGDAYLSGRPDGSRVSQSRNPSWSPDGAKIAFTSSQEVDDYGSSMYGDAEIFVMNADGSNKTQLTFNDDADLGAVWSPDGSQIAFISKHGSIRFQIFVMNADGSNQRQLTNNEYGNSFAPSWSPDGSQIAFLYDRDVFVMNADGSNRTQLTFDRDNNTPPFWLP